MGRFVNLNGLMFNWQGIGLEHENVDIGEILVIIYSYFYFIT